jgi:predicted transcriptional regulator with HTH domain
MTYLEKFNILDAKVKRLEKMRSELVSEIHKTVINHFEEVSGVAVGKQVQYKGKKGVIHDVLITKIECSEHSKYYDVVEHIKGKTLKKDGTFSDTEISLNSRRIIFDSELNFDIDDYYGVRGSEYYFNI